MDIRQLLHDPAARLLLDERARALAARESAAAGHVGEEILTFRLGDGRYALPVRFVREVYPLQNWTPLPATPAHVVGLVNVRGHLLAALDLRPLLELAAEPPRSGACLLIVAAGSVEVGLLADEVVEVTPGDVDLAVAPSVAAGRGVAWVRGFDRQLTLWLDPALLLADQRLVVKFERA